MAVEEQSVSVCAAAALGEMAMRTLDPLISSVTIATYFCLGTGRRDTNKRTIEVRELWTARMIPPDQRANEVASEES